MGVLQLGIRIFIPGNSARGKKFRAYIEKVRNRRAYNFTKARYNKNRHDYYAHAVTKQTKNQETKISIVVPCFNTPKKYFEPLLSSVFSQGYENWELVLVDASNNKQANYLKRRAEADKRITYLKTDNKGIASNTNKGIEIASGELIAFLDHDDTLDHDALLEAAEAFRSNDSFDLVYSDEDKISDTGETYFEAHFKPDFSLDMLRNLNYITHFVVAKTALVKKLGGIREGFDGAQDYDFLLRVVDSGANIGHIPKILYHWREAEGSTAADFSNKQHVTDAGCQALQDHYERQGIKNVTVKAIENRPGFYRTYYELEDAKRHISINFGDTKLTDAEKNYILDAYRSNKDVKKYHISVSQEKISDRDAQQFEVNGTFIPVDANTDIAALFGLAAEKGVGGVSPKIIKDGRIYDSGIVKVGNTKKPLFRGVNPNRPIGFGSVEWVRNVDELTGNVAVYGTGTSKDYSRLVIWSHTVFIALSPVFETKPEVTKFYNPNLIEYREVVENPHDYIVELIETKK